VTRGVEWLKAQGASVIGLETMPRTMDNIGFYSRLGFLPGRLTITTTIDAAHGDAPVQLLSRLTPRARDDALTACRELVSGLLPGYDYTREITLTADLALGDTALLYQRDHLVGFALAHNAPLVEGRVREELRVLKLAVTDEASRRNASRRASFAGRVSWSIPALDRARGTRALDRLANVADGLRGETSRTRARPVQLGDLSSALPT